jgi:hypothetical protein
MACFPQEKHASLRKTLSSATGLQNLRLESLVDLEGKRLASLGLLAKGVKRSFVLRRRSFAKMLSIGRTIELSAHN